MGIVAAAQIASVFYDAKASARRVAESIAEAAKSGAWLVVFTESCIPGYPDWVWRVSPRSSSPSADPFATFERRFVEQAITVPGPETDIIAAACRKHRSWLRLASPNAPWEPGRYIIRCSTLAPMAPYLAGTARWYPPLPRGSSGARAMEPRCVPFRHPRHPGRSNLLGKYDAARQNHALRAGRADLCRSHAG